MQTLLNEGALSASMRRRKAQEAIKAQRAARFARGVYGPVQTVALPKAFGFVYDPPSYRDSQRAAQQAKNQRRDGVDRKIDLRCFFTGIPCDLTANEIGANRDPRILPWAGTRDHLVPMRRGVPGEPADVVARASTSLVWTSNVANTTLGLAPLLVRITIRRWLMTIPFSRTDTSVAHGNLVRWLIIGLMDEFRFNGRFPWSRQEGVSFEWIQPEVSKPFMERMWDAERKFLSLDAGDRERFINTMQWRF